MPQLPDWLPWWALVLVLIPAGLYALLFFLMPFSVFGLKGRLDLIESRLDELQFMIRQLNTQVPDLPPPEPEMPRRNAFGRAPRDAPPRETPREYGRDVGRETRAAPPEPPPRTRPEPTDRMEPRLNWPRGGAN